MKTDKMWKPDADGVVKVVEVARHERANVSTDLFLQNALQRRGLALDMTDLCAFATHETLVRLLIGEYLRPPPTGYARVSLEQLHRADREIWRILAVRCRSGVRRRGDGVRPIEEAIPAVLADPGVRLLLMPLTEKAARNAAGSGDKRARSPSSARDEPAGKKKRLTRGQRRAKAKERAQAGGQRGQAPPALGGKAAKGKGKGAGKRESPMPPGLEGKCHRTAAGDPICFNYNLPSGCQHSVAAGGRCPRGFHVCAEPGCGAAHPLTGHR